MNNDEILFADCEGDNFVEDLTTLWTIQVATGVNGEVTVYADQPGYPSLEEGVDRLHNCKKVAFHNGMGFDLEGINKLYPGALEWHQMIDTMIILRMMDAGTMRASLGELGSALGFPKGDFKDFSQFSPEMVPYGIRDVEILQRGWEGFYTNPKTGKTRRLKTPLGKFYDKYRDACEAEFHTAHIIQKQTLHGFRFDAKGAVMLEADLRVEYKDLDRELQQTFPPIVTPRFSDKQFDKATGKPKRLKDKVEVFNPGSTDQIADRLIAKYDWKPRQKTPTGKVKITEDILTELPYPEAKQIAAYMKHGKKLSQLAGGDNAWLKMMKERSNGDVYIHGQVNTLGTRTTRMSHFKPNVAQADGDKRMRGLWLPDVGHKLVGVDAEGLELRMLAHYLAKFDGGFYAETVHSGDKAKGTDIHTVNQKVAGLYSRNSAKTMIYAFLYGCGDAKLGDIVVEDAKEAGMPIPKGSRSSIGKELRKKLEVGIKGLGKLIKQCKTSHAQFESLPGLDGRRIKNLSDHAALNTLLQGNGSIVMKKALSIFDDLTKEHGLIQFDLAYPNRVFDMAYCANVHDEFQLSVVPSKAQLVADLGMNSIALAGDALNVRCPLVGAADIGDSWADTH